LESKSSKSDKLGKMPDYEFPLLSFSAGKEGEEDSLSSSLIQLYANLILNTDRFSRKRTIFSLFPVQYS
jgi:hypothetical protein